MQLKVLTPKDLKTFDDKYKLLEDYPDNMQWYNFERGFIAAVWAGWFITQNGAEPGKDANREDIVKYIEDYPEGLSSYTDLCQEIVMIYRLGRQSFDDGTGQKSYLPTKDPNS